MLGHAIKAWMGPDPRVHRQHRVFERDGWRCTVPGCSSRRNLHDHHIVFRTGVRYGPGERIATCRD